VINLGDSVQVVQVGSKATAWLMEASSPDSKTITINSKQPRLEDSRALSGMEGVAVSAGVTVHGKSIAFIAIPNVHNRACQ
jgi:hypothetical protein